MVTYRTPGIHRASVVARLIEPGATGIPAMIGATGAATKEPVAIETWPEFLSTFADRPADGYLGPAVRGFFENGGRRCFVVGFADPTSAALAKSLEQLESFDQADLVCAPDIALVARADATATDPETVATRMRAMVIATCDSYRAASISTRDRFAILDSSYRRTPRAHGGGVSGTNGAFYYPWVRVVEGPESTGGFIPPCGHIAGAYARADAETGVHRAPANMALEGVIDLETSIDDGEQADLNKRHINCLRAFPARGIRVWGGRTVSITTDWRYVSVRRLFLTVARHVERVLGDVAFEPNDGRLWARIERELAMYFDGLLAAGALKGTNASEAYYVRCDDETNPAEVRDTGSVITEIGLAPSNPYEFVVVQISHGADGVSISGPSGPLKADEAKER